MPRAQPTHGTETATVLLDDIQARLPPNVTPQDALQAVVCTLSQHVSGGEARHLWRALPDPVKPLLERCMLHRAEPPRTFGRDELLARISGHLGVSSAEAERIASAVLTAVSRRLPQKEVDSVASQLPRELRELWHARRT